MLENQHPPEVLHPKILPLKHFIPKITRTILLGLLTIAIALGMGMWGYHHYESMGWIDAYVNAAMILSGMGPVQELKTEAGKIFAGTYALFSGTFFLIVIALVLAPVFHRVIHKLHIEQESKRYKE